MHSKLNKPAFASVNVEHIFPAMLHVREYPGIKFTSAGCQNFHPRGYSRYQKN